MAYHPFRHLGLKLLSVILAVLLWWTVAGEPTVERNVRVPLQFQNLSQTLQIVGEPPSTIDVRVRGSTARLSGMEAGAVVAILDLAQAQPGFRMINVFKEHVRVPFGVTVEQVLTPTIPLELEEVVARVVPVVPAIEGKPAAGFAVGQVQSIPPSVSVLGPANRIPATVQATTEPVSVQNAREWVRAEVNVGIADPMLRLQTAQTATVIVEIVPAPVERTMTRVPIIARNLGAGLHATIVPGVATLVVRGLRERVDGLTVDRMSVSVDANGLDRGEHRLEVRVARIRDVELSRVDPTEVLVRIE